MKLIKSWTDGEFHVEITSAFFTNGDKYLDDDWIRQERDLVKFEAKIYDTVNGFEAIDTFYGEATEYTETVKLRFFRDNITRQVSIYESYEDVLEHLIKKCNSQIYNMRKNKLITDGLPDSLKNL